MGDTFTEDSIQVGESLEDSHESATFISKETLRHKVWNSSAMKEVSSIFMQV